ncbi:MAG TPA: hypothetical protein VLM37_00030, partial [Fibrobacteraceae bacterium]|nr:hypothetical protein [Fibrobacteraceae bacterium]
RIPFTPKSWYSSKLNDRVSRYRIVKDSLSLWSFLEDGSPLVTLRAGFTWNSFIGMELFGVRTVHDVKLADDTLYDELDHWSFTRYEVGLTTHITGHKQWLPVLESQPFFFLGFHLSFLSEDIGLKDGDEASDYYKRRITFASYYKGALIGVGHRLVWNRRLAFETRMGLNNRGKFLDTEPSSDAVAEPTVIGGSTLDCFLSASLEYHWHPTE